MEGLMSGRVSIGEVAAPREGGAGSENGESGDQALYESGASDSVSSSAETRRPRSTLTALHSPSPPSFSLPQQTKSTPPIIADLDEVVENPCVL